MGSDSLRARVHELLDPGSPETLAQATDWALIVLVLTNVAAGIVASVPAVLAAYHGPLAGLEAVSLATFGVEYALRVWTAPEQAPWRERGPWRARLAFVLRPGSLFDLAAILPALVVAGQGGDLGALVIPRLLRFLKLARYSPGLASLADAIWAERRALGAASVILSGTVLAAASLMHLAEGAVQPERFGTIPDAMYWAVVTVTTGGYGDVVPATGPGRVVSALTAISGLVMLALPVGIIASAFAREIHRRDFVVTWTMVARVPLFAGLDARQGGAVMRYLRSQSCEPGEVIVRRGEPADAMYIISAGEAEVDLPSGPVRLGPGQFFGEMGLLARRERAATVTARTPCKLLALDAGDLRHLMDGNPAMAARITAGAESRTAGRSEPEGRDGGGALSPPA